MKKIPLFKVFISKSAGEILTNTLYSGWIGEGPRVRQFEKMLGNWIGADRLLAVNSATSGLHLLIHLLKTQKIDKNSKVVKNTESQITNKFVKISEDDEILTSPLTCVATNWPILANGLNIRWVDVDSTDLNINLLDLNNKISSKTKLIVVVHWGGYSIDLNKLNSILNGVEDQLGFRPIVIEDCAHALGSTFNNKFIGTHGNYCVFSFQAVKNLTTSDGGAIVIPNDINYSRALKLRWYGIDRNNHYNKKRHSQNIDEWGFKFAMNDVMASIGIANLRHLPWILERQRLNAEFFFKELKKISGITTLNYSTNRLSSYFLFTLIVEEREKFEKSLHSCGIEAWLPHRRNDWYSCVKKYKVGLPILDSIYDKITCIPVGWWIGVEEREYIISCIQKGW